MKLPRLIFSAAAAFVFLLAVDALLWPLLWPDGPPEYFVNARSQPLAGAKLAATILVSLLLAYVFPIGYRGGKLWVEGMRFGMLMGALVGFSHGLYIYAMADVQVAGLLTTVLWTIITWGVAGALIAAIYSRASLSSSN